MALNPSGDNPDVIDLTKWLEKGEPARGTWTAPSRQLSLLDAALPTMQALSTRSRSGILRCALRISAQTPRPQLRPRLSQRMVLCIFDNDPASDEANLVEVSASKHSLAGKLNEASAETTNAASQEHSFTITYPDRSDVGLTISHTNAQRGKRTSKEISVSASLPLWRRRSLARAKEALPREQGKGSKNEIKKDTTIFIRTLITVLQTMENLPDVRYVSMRLHYNHTCPDDYEPECFRHVNSHDVKYFTEEPTSIEVGKIATSYHEMTMKVKMKEDMMSTDPVQTTTPDTIAPSSQHQPVSPVFGQGDEHEEEDDGDEDENGKGGSLYFQCLQWAQRQESVKAVNLAKHLSIPPTEAEKMCAKMQDDGILGVPTLGRRAVLAQELTQESQRKQVLGEVEVQPQHSASSMTQSAQHGGYVEDSEKENSPDTDYLDAIRWASRCASIPADCPASN